MSSRRAKRTHFLCQIASHIPLSPSMRPARAIFSLLLDPSLFLPLYGGLCLLSEAQNTDSFHELNMILKNTMLFRRAHTIKTHFFKEREREGWREQVVGSGDSLFLSPHTDRWTVRALMKANGCIRTHRGYPWDTTDVCGKISLPCKNKDGRI